MIYTCLTCLSSILGGFFTLQPEGPTKLQVKQGAPIWVFRLHRPNGPTAGTGTVFATTVFSMVFFNHIPITDPWKNGIYTYMNGWFLWFSCRYTSPMDPMGYDTVITFQIRLHHLTPSNSSASESVQFLWRFQWWVSLQMWSIFFVFMWAIKTKVHLWWVDLWSWQEWSCLQFVNVKFFKWGSHS